MPPAPESRRPPIEPCAAGDRDEHRRHGADHDRQRHQPAADQLPRRQREEIERERLSEDRIDEAGRRRSVPIERERRPLGHQAGAGGERDDRRAAERCDLQHRLDRQLDRLTVDHDRQAGQLAEPGGLDREERAVDDDERRHREEREHRCLQVQRLPEHLGVAERAEPQRIDVVRQGGAAAEEDDGEQREQEETAARPRFTRRRPVDGFSHA